jgi:hypothetical protein
MEVVRNGEALLSPVGSSWEETPISIALPPESSIDYFPTANASRLHWLKLFEPLV